LALLLLAGLVLLPLAVALWVADNWTDPERESRAGPCEATTKPALSTAERQVELGVRQGEITNLAFGRSFETKRLTVSLEPKDQRPIRARPRRLRLLISEFRRSDDARFPTRAIHAQARVEQQLVRMRLCIERLPEIDPGTYTGSLTITDPRVREVAVPIIITVAYPHWSIPAYLLILVILSGAVYVYGLHQKLGPTEQIFSRASGGRILRWLSQWGGVVALVTGSAAALSAYTASYLASPDWGANTSQFLGLIATSFTAFVTASSATQVAARKAGEPEDGETAAARSTIQ
jgi:hypothetical protein